MRFGRHASAAEDEVVVPVEDRPAPAESSVHQGGRRLGEVLVESGLVSRADVLAALDKKRKGAPQRLGRLLIDSGALSERDLTAALARQNSLQVVDLRDLTPAPEALALMSDSTAHRLQALPIGFSGDSVTVAVADGSAATAAAVEEALQRPVVLRLAAQSELRRAIDSSYRALAHLEDQVKVFEARDAVRRDAVRAETEAVADDAPVVQVVDKILTQALRDRASDVHVEPQEERVRVRYRIDGALHDVLELPGSMGPALTSRIKIMAGMNIVERRRPQDGQITTSIEDRDVDIRVSTVSVVGGEKVVMRVLDKSRPLFDLGRLGMPEEMVERYRAQIHSPYGMVVCSGPTGSGKTTTLYGSLGELNSPDRNIMTIEDPVEYTFPSINQIQINEQAGVTFANGLRAILRQDPDVILVGEIRDAETARIAVQSALTGHFVLSSVHATDTVSALFRLVDMGIETFLVASSVTTVLAQRLVRRVCGYCQAAHAPTREEVAFLESLSPGVSEDAVWVRGTGCTFCAQTGYLDRVGVYEMMPITSRIREMVVDRSPHDDVRKTARAEGMNTLVEQAAQLVRAGVTTTSEVMRSVYVVGG
ncbi:GspE/PulE family protein [Geodermatophilus sp. SYSU D01036]